jgi:LPXTG-motif cell wall-anchored protein
MVLALVSCVSLLLASAAVAQEKTTKTEMRTFEVLSVDGNKVVARTDRGTREYTVPPEWRITVDGKEIGVADLKPGMKGSAQVTTTTVSTPIVVTEIKNADVLAVQANTIIVRGADGVKKYTVQDVKDRNVTIVKDGAPIELSQLRPGDKLTATIITKYPPKVMTETQVNAAIKSPPSAASSAPSSAAQPAPAPAPSSAAAEPAPAGHAKKLPKTGSDLPLLAWLASLSLGAGFGLTVRRLRRAN